ncbi:hypothetical protein BLA29_006918 [Euroglyphus maynei]|uniref:SHSP domain-containing protein n=1 Tax=Euroglyphus maynei TaxID=6958 RepID=A0A1Y3BNA5_EURMA|nr:hypothetical protein BLA29_006918 [Euroglyphus maynei]
MSSTIPSSFSNKNINSQQQRQPPSSSSSSQRSNCIEKIENYYRTSENVYRLDNHPNMSDWIVNYPRQLNFHPHIHNRNDLYRLNVDVIGYKPENISVSTKDDLLIINGHYEQQQNDDDFEQHHHHHNGGCQSKEFIYKYKLPKFVNKDKMTCLFKDRGQLLIEAPIEQPNTRNIPIKILKESSSSGSKTLNNDRPSATKIFTEKIFKKKN